jgi:CelD/BcsL family acetyltransferase involved in cellulose biosynthesis
MQKEGIAAVVIQTLKANGVELFIGDKAYALLEKRPFQASWDLLYNTCTWATIFQSRTFVSTWYQVYSSKCLPIIVASFDGDKLTGLLTLTMTKDGDIVGAGEEQAEYQTWLTANDSGSNFVQSALKLIHQHFPKAKFQLKFIPGATPLQWLEQSPFKKRCIAEVVNQPLLKIDDAHFARELQKKNRREKINRLKRIGELRLEKICGQNEFEGVLDELAIQYDFRKLAMHNRVFFMKDPHKKNFLCTLFKKQILHATILKVNDEIIASNVGVTGKSWVHLQGVNTHSPVYAKYSPGILHFLMLGRVLSSEDVTVFDLTPGGDTYKTQLATDTGIAYKLTVHTPVKTIIAKTKLSAIRGVKRWAEKVITPARLRTFKWEAAMYKDRMRHVSKQGLSYFLERLVASLNQPPRLCTYIWTSAIVPTALAGFTINRNSLQDLLCFDPVESMLTRWEFIHDAMCRFEEGKSCYTCCEEGRLVGCIWVSVLNASKSSSSDQDTLRSEEKTLLHDFYYHPQVAFQQNEFWSAVIAAEVCNKRKPSLYATVSNKNNRVVQVLKDNGFMQLEDKIESL